MLGFCILFFVKEMLKLVFILIYLRVCVNLYSMKIPILKTNKILLVVVMFLANIFTNGNLLKAKIVCGPASNAGSLDKYGFACGIGLLHINEESKASSDLVSNEVPMPSLAIVAVNDATTTAEDTPVTINVTTNDIDPLATINVATVDLDSSTIGIQNTFTSAHGFWSVNASGVVSFTPSLNYNGTDSISYTVNDNIGVSSNVATITITITAVNDVPVAADDTATTPEDIAVAVNV